MAKKIMILQGSPRKNGNTAALVEWFSAGAREAGAEVEVVEVARLDYASYGCTSCFGCQRSDTFECVIDDEARPILARIPDADILVIATPVYFAGPSAQLKVFFDRAFSLFKFDPDTGEVRHRLAGKTLCLIASAGGRPEDGLNFTEQTYRGMSEFIEAGFRSLCVPFAPRREGVLRGDEDLKRRATALGKELASG